ncbi:MAG: hypothetical protein J1E63_02415 [Muribaculaceae bacterium]|nr:hypothetical protein [Muribaculaceae bacterium]
MDFTKANVSMDMKNIAELPIEERMKYVDNLTTEQYHQYIQYLTSKSINEGRKHTREIIVDYTMEDEIKKGTAIDLDEYLKRKRKELGLKS